MCWLAGLRCVAAFGGLSKFEQFKELKAGMPRPPVCFESTPCPVALAS